MNRFLLAVGILVAICGAAFADDTITVANVPSTFETYVVGPVRTIHRGAWGVLSLAFKVGKAPIDAAFELVGKAVGSDPNEPLWS